MHLYLHLGDQVGTLEARELAQQLAAWHDAMVKHVRVAGPRRLPTCHDECPHREAGVLWAAAEQTFGERAQELIFLRTHGQRARLAPPRGSPPPDTPIRM